MKGAVTKNVQSLPGLKNINDRLTLSTNLSPGVTHNLPKDLEFTLSTNLSSGVTHNLPEESKDLEFNITIPQNTRGNAIFNVGELSYSIVDISITSVTTAGIKRGKRPLFPSTAEYAIGFSPVKNTPPVDIVIQPCKSKSFSVSNKICRLGVNKWLCIYIAKNSANNFTNEVVKFNIKIKAY